MMLKMTLVHGVAAAIIAVPGVLTLLKVGQMLRAGRAATRCVAGDGPAA